ncbi:MAG: hypothetical protein AB7V56_12510 [Candidatus Nitrosocosmicus sp.]
MTIVLSLTSLGAQSSFTQIEPRDLLSILSGSIVCQDGEECQGSELADFIIGSNTSDMISGLGDDDHILTESAEMISFLAVMEMIL